ncbi:non-specific lipid transfer protein-like 1 [Aegilops tauschii subsp. strangulata]|uniref:Bifunctional inhibitor/plant lipid transfer protein/seed storage helical domain-containing protein n=2 Tax=Aegilops tauschii TaxID=37682 RepID=A0A453PMG9_AEGTS|nr:non-specific lipid transfer protein-like 1 isoform X2 [Aegilops tauschii subsp. strangulata]XP_044420977.1 non-specific lipid transfer protein-like 1 isoform X1 [Triticum aestivum]
MALTGGATTAACILVLLALADAAGAATRAPAPAPAPDCMEALISLADCLDYVTPSTKSARPSKACCTEVKTAVGTPATVKCLCAAMDAKTTPIPINMTRVLALPTACGQSASVLNKCHAAHGPGGAPAEAPSPSASSGGATASPPKANVAARSPGGSATVLLATVVTSLLAFYYL